MKKKMKVWLIIAAILCGVGLLTFSITFAAVGFDYRLMDTIDAVDSAYVINDAFDSILINVESADVRFEESADGSVKVLIHEKENEPHSVSVHNGKLMIFVNECAWYEDILSYYFGSESITILLPRESGVSLKAETDTGDVTLADTLLFGDVAIETDTGDVTVASEVSGLLSLTSDTGDVVLRNTMLSSAYIETDTGDIEISSVRFSGALGIETDTGDVDLNRSIVAGDVAIETDTGDVDFSRIDAANLYVVTDTGDVEGSLLSEKIFIIKTDTGDKKVPHTTQGGICKITTDTGDIEITLVKE